MLPPKQINLTVLCTSEIWEYFRQTIPTKNDQEEIGRSLQHTIHFYCQLRAALKMPELVVCSQAEAASTKYLQTLIDGFK